MSEINTISLVNQMRVMAAQAQGNNPEVSAAGEFSAVFKNALADVNNLQQNSDQLKGQYEMGAADVSVGEVMVAAQKANLAFEATVRVRNELVKAYKEIMDTAI